MIYLVDFEIAMPSLKILSDSTVKEITTYTICKEYATYNYVLVGSEFCVHVALNIVDAAFIVHLCNLANLNEAI